MRHHYDHGIISFLASIAPGFTYLISGCSKSGCCPGQDRPDIRRIKGRTVCQHYNARPLCMAIVRHASRIIALNHLGVGLGQVVIAVVRSSSI